MFLYLDQTAWTAIAAIGSIVVAFIAVIPIFRDRAKIKVTIKNLEEISSTGRIKIALTITNCGRRTVYLDRIMVSYVDVKPYEKTIDVRECEIHEGRWLTIIDDSWSLTSISKPRRLMIIDTVGRKWKTPYFEFKKLVKVLEIRNKEKAKTVKQEVRDRKNKKKQEIAKSEET